MRFPTIHLNGTSHGELSAQNEEARRAIRAALQALSDAAPNARDYYTQDPAHAFNEAQREHDARMARLRNTLNELEQIAEAIADQPDNRSRR